MAKRFLYVWLVSMVIFASGFATQSNQILNIDPELYTIFYICIVGVGVVAFILMCIFALVGIAKNPKERKIGLAKSVKSKKQKDSNKLKYFAAGGFVILLLSAGLLNVRAMKLEQAQKVQSYELLKNTTATPTPTLVPSVKGTTSKTTPVNTDPIVNCNFTYLPDQQMKSSECSKSFECQIFSQWYIYTSHEKCDQDQARASNSGGSNTITNSNEIVCSVIGYSQTKSVWTYLLTPEECVSAKTSSNTPQVTYTPTPIRTIDPAIAQQVIQQCLDRAQSTYNYAKSDCSYKARANGLTSSSWYNSCLQTATENYTYERNLCN